MDKNMTRDLYDDISKCNDLTKYLRENENKFISVSLAEYLELLIESKDVVKKELIKSAGIEKSYLYQIFNGRRNPSRDKLIRISLALRCSLESTQKLLIVAEKPILYPSRRRDAALMFCLNKGFSLDKTQIYLYDLDFEILD